MSRFLKTCLVQYLSFDEVRRLPGGPPGEQKWLTSVRLLLLRGDGGVMAHIEKKYSVHDLHVYFAKK